jgi:hypothetical protein
MDERTVIADWGNESAARKSVLEKKPTAYLIASPDADSYTGILFQVIEKDVYGEVEGEQSFVRIAGSDWHDNAMNAWEDALRKLNQ